MGGHTGVQPPVDVSKLSPSQALTALLQHAQEDHRKCVVAAQKANLDVVEKCSLTWGEVHLRWLQFAAYRAPFKDDVAETTYSKYWTRKRQEWDDNRLF
jgi:hypothetical protein